MADTVKADIGQKASWDSPGQVISLSKANTETDSCVHSHFRITNQPDKNVFGLWEKVNVQAIQTVRLM